MSSVLVFVSGAALLIYSAEKLIGYLVRMAQGFRISLFLLAIIFTGIEFDDVFFGVAVKLEDMDGVALGVVVGTAISLPGIVLGLAALVAPTKVSVPRGYLVLFALAPLALVWFVVKGSLTRADGIVLIGLFVAFMAYAVVRESRTDRPVFRDAEMYETYAAVRGPGPRFAPTAVATAPLPVKQQRSPLVEEFAQSGWTGLGLAVLALAGLVVGAATMGIGTKGILSAYHLDGTVFGATIATLVLSVEDIFLTAEPFRKGAAEIGVGNVIGSLIFSVTAKLGIILLVGSLVIGQYLLTWHLPVLVGLTLLATYFLATGRLRRWHGVVLLALYAAYWLVTFFGMGLVPADT